MEYTRKSVDATIGMGYDEISQSMVFSITISGNFQKKKCAEDLIAIILSSYNALEKWAQNELKVQAPLGKIVDSMKDIGTLQETESRGF